MAKILIVDDSPVEIKIIRRRLGNDHEIVEAINGQIALELANEMLPDLILLDIIMPGMDGISVCKILKSQSSTADIPVIFITSVSTSQDVVKGFEAGGQDYITKPFYSLELCARIKVHLDLKKSKETLVEYAAELEEKNQELQDLLVKLETTAMTDFVTGLANRRSMMQRIKGEAARLKRNEGRATLVIADIDDFKKVNDTYGHDCGDVVLKEVSDWMKSVLREGDVLARWGGEEFLFMLPDTDVADGQVVAEKIRKLIETRIFSCQEKTFSVTLTFGVAELDQELGFDASIKQADEALYKGKKLLKNCVVSYLYM